MPHDPSLTAAAYDAAVYGFRFDLARYLVGAGLIAAIVAILRRTSWAGRKIQKRTATRTDLKRELIASLRTIVVYTVLSVPMVWAYRNGWLPEYHGSVGPLGFAAYLAAIVIAHDAWFYWSHRAMHTPLLYRRFHRFHHLTITPTPWTAYSFAIPEAAVMFAFMPAYLSLVPTPEPVVFVFLAVMILRNAMGHAGLELHPAGWARHPLLKWISTTTHHDMHHGVSYHHNFGFYFTWWDKLMGTEHPDYVRTFERVTGRAEPAQPLTTSASPQTTA